MNISKAIRSKDPVALNDLLKKDAWNTRPDKEKYSALETALKYDNIQAFEALLKAGAPLDIKNEQGETLLHKACFKGRLEWVKKIYQTASHLLESQNLQGDTPLFYALVSGSTACIQYLIEHGANIHHRNHEQTTPLIHLGNIKAHSHLPELLQILLRAGADINAKDHLGLSVIMRCAMRGFNAGFLSLLSQGATLSFESTRGENALVLVCRQPQDCPEIVQSCLESGLASNSCDQWGVPVLCLGVQRGHLQGCRTLLEAGAPPNQTDRSGRTSLHYAVRAQSSQDMFALLLSQGAEIQYTDNQGFTPLFQALAYHHNDIALFLIQAGAPCNTYLISGTQEFSCFDLTLGVLDDWFFERSTPPLPTLRLLNTLKKQGAPLQNASRLLSLPASQDRKIKKWVTQKISSPDNQ